MAVQLIQLPGGTWTQPAAIAAVAVQFRDDGLAFQYRMVIRLVDGETLCISTHDNKAEADAARDAFAKSLNKVFRRHGGSVDVHGRS